MHSVLGYLNNRPGRGLVVAATLVLLVAACEEQLPPAACGSISPVTIVVGERSSVTACFDDPNGDLLNYTAASANTGVATASARGETITVTAVSPGNTSVTVTASDPYGMTGTQSFQVTVTGHPDLLFTAVTPRSVTVSSSDTATAEFTVANGGSGPSDSTLARVFLSADTIITTSDREMGVFDTFSPLDPADTVSFEIGFTFHESWTSHTIHLGVCLDVVPGEANRNNNCSPAFTVTITASSTRAASDAGSESASDAPVVLPPALTARRRPTTLR